MLRKLGVKPSFRGERARHETDEANAWHVHADFIDPPQQSDREPDFYEFTPLTFDEVDDAVFLPFFFAFAQRLTAAFFAAALRSSGVIFA